MVNNPALFQQLLAQQQRYLAAAAARARQQGLVFQAPFLFQIPPSLAAAAAAAAAAQKTKATAGPVGQHTSLGQSGQTAMNLGQNTAGHVTVAPQGQQQLLRVAEQASGKGASRAAEKNLN